MNGADVDLAGIPEILEERSALRIRSGDGDAAPSGLSRRPPGGSSVWPEAWSSKSTIFLRPPRLKSALANSPAKVLSFSGLRSFM